MRAVIASAILLVFGHLAGAQEDTVAKKRLRSPAVARGTIGGESHDSYMVHAEKGRTLAVEISWEREGENRAEFTVTESANFGGAPVAFGSESDAERRWSGKVP